MDDLPQPGPRARTNLGFGILGGILVFLPAIVAVSAQFLAPYDPQTPDVTVILMPPSPSHLLGTDELGRDLFSRLLYGSRISLSVGFVSVGIMLIIGVTLGSVSGYYGGWVDSLIMRFVDIMLCLPTFFLILAIIAFVTPSILAIMAVIGATGWMDVARLVRAEFLTLKEREFTLAAKAQGAPDLTIILRHILPNALGPVFVAGVLGVAGAILTESALSFLGLGVQPPTPSWGNILTSGKDVMVTAWWVSLFPGLAILGTVLGFNLLGESLREGL